MKSNKSLYIAAIVAVLAGSLGTSAMAQTENQECQHGIFFGSLEGTTLKTKNDTHTFKLSAEDAAVASYWNSGDYLRLCGNDKITNISFRSLPTVTDITEKAPTPVSTATEKEATTDASASAEDTKNDAVK